MKFTLSRDDLVSALAFCRTILRTGENPILSNCLVNANGNQLLIASHAIYSSKYSSMEAKIFEGGASTIPLDALYQITSGAPKDQKISIVVKDRATITWGRSRYTLGTLADDIFPKLLTAEMTNAMNLDDGSRRDLFSRPAQLLLADQSVPLYCGCWLHERDGKIASIGSDGTRMLCPVVDHGCNGMQPVMVPRLAALEIEKMGATSVWWDKNIIEARAGANTYSARLIEASYDKYGHLVPGLDSPALSFNRAELCGALHRLSALADHGSVVKLSWANNPKAATLEFVSSEGQEIISCSGKISAGAVGLPPIRFRELIELFAAETIMLHINEPMKPIRVHSPDEPHTLCMQSPCRIVAR